MTCPTCNNKVTKIEVSNDGISCIKCKDKPQKCIICGKLGLDRIGTDTYCHNCI